MFFRWLAAFVALLLFSPAPVRADTPLTYQRVDFSTEVSREVANDQMNAVLSIELTDKDPSKLAQQLTLAMNEALKKAAAYPTVKASSGNQSTWPVYGISPTPSSKLEGWRGRNELRLESKDFAAAGELIGKLQEKLQMNGISFSVAADTRRKVEDSLTAEAVAAFKARAEAVRAAWNAKSYRLVHMNMGSSGGPMPYMAMARGMEAKGGDASVPQQLAGGETRLAVNVSGSIELQP